MLLGLMDSFTAFSQERQSPWLVKNELLYGHSLWWTISVPSGRARFISWASIDQIIMLRRKGMGEKGIHRASAERFVNEASEEMA
jgi:hypothetical protein